VGVANSGRGGNGVLSSITGNSIYRAGGGGGGFGNGATVVALGGLGGGGQGSTSITSNGFSAQNNTGGGGGGGGANANTHIGGNGGSGIVIIRYPIGQLEITPLANPIVATGGNTIEEDVYGGSQ
jgi:hypothetical protein